MKITAATIKDFKRIKSVTITPEADRTIVLIGGKNAQGKSSILDALIVAIGGKRAQPIDPVRHGAAEAEITVELDGGELTISRVIQPGGESVLEVRDRLGTIKSPQAMLDKLVGSRFLDPVGFLKLPAKEQRAQLMRSIDGADRIAGLNEKRERAFTKRTEVGRDRDRAAGELTRLPELEVGTPIDVAALTAESKRLAEVQRAGDGLGNVLAQCRRETAHARQMAVTTSAERKKIEEEIGRLQARAAVLERKVAEWEADEDKCALLEAAAQAKLDAAGAEWTALLPRRDQLDADIGRADAHNRAVFANEAHMKRRAETAASVTALTKEYDDLSKVIATIDSRKADILSAAKLPVDGLSVTDEGIELAGVPFLQASAAEQLRVAVGLAISAAPGLDDVWIRDGALLDDESLAIVAEQAAAAGKRVWVERVGTRDPGVIVIQDGKVAS